MTPRDEQFPRTNKVLNDLMREDGERLLLGEIEARDAEIIRMREALRQIAEYDSDEAIFYVDIARAALDGKEEA